MSDENQEKDILEKIADAHRQATEEHSHFYMGRILRECAEEIMRLRESLSILGGKKS